LLEPSLTSWNGFNTLFRCNVVPYALLPKLASEVVYP